MRFAPCVRALALIALVLIAAPAVTMAQTDEIQVYDGSLAPPGKFNLTLHTNFTPAASRRRHFPAP